MTENPTCPTCHAPLPPGVDLGACPRCLLAAGLEDLSSLFPQLEVLGLVGQGGMGVVYKARQKSLDRLVALKLLPAALADDPAFGDRFQREARTMARLDHPNIVRVHDFGEAEGRFYLLMEFVDGPNLRQVIERGGLEPREALRIVPAICDALQYAHDRGIVHRDIKPENVLLDREGHVKITDFGLAKLLHHDAGQRTLTRAGQVMGTPHYMAPEQYRTPDDVDHRADIYSLGVVFYEMLTGEVPMGRFEPPSQRVEVDVRLDEVVLRTLAREREKRYQRADEVRTRITSIAETPPPPPPPTPVASAPGARSAPPEPRMSRLAVWGFLLSVFGVLVLPIGLAVVASMVWRSSRLAFVGPSFLLALLMTLTGIGLSIAGWVAIARSRGALRGLGLAVTGALLPVLLVPLVGFGWLLTARVEAPRSGGDAHGRPIGSWVVENDGEQTAYEIRATWAAIRGVLLKPKVTPADLRAFVDPVDASRMAAARVEDTARMRSDEVLGLPGLGHAVGSHPLADLEVTEIETGPSTSGAVLVHLEKDGEGVVVPMAKKGVRWHFAIGPVQRLPGRTATWNTPDLLKGAPLDLDARRVAQTEIELLFSVWQCCWEGGDMPVASRIPRAHLPWLLSPSLKGRWEQRSSAELAEEGKDGSWGALFLDASTLPQPLAGFELTMIELAPDAHTAVVTAAAPRGASFRFPVVKEDGHWWFALDPIERAD